MECNARPSIFQPGSSAVSSFGPWLITAIAVVLWAAAIGVISHAFDLLNIGQPASLIALLATLATIALMRRLALPVAKWRALTLPISSFFLITVLGALAAGRLLDWSWDGVAYHLPSIVQISEGRSLFWERPWVMFTMTYPSGVWRLLATTGGVIGSIEASRAIFLPIALATGIITGAALQAWCGQQYRSAAVVVSVLLMLNPVVSEQADSFYVDKFVYTYGLLLIAIALLPPGSLKPAHLAVGAAAFLLLVDAKLTGIYFGTILLALSLVRHRRQLLELIRYPRIVAPGLSLLVVVGGIALCQPYMTNLWWTGKLVYPPAEVLQKGDRPTGMKFDGVFATLESLSVGMPLLDPNEPIRYVPWPFSWIDFHRYSEPGPRLGGFGPLMPALMLISLGLGFWVYTACRRVRDILLVSVVVGASCLFFPAGLCARFVPFFWVVPVLVGLAAWVMPRSRRFGGVFLILLAMNATFVLSGAVAGRIVKYEWFAAIVDDWRRSNATLVMSHPASAVLYLEFGAVFSWNDSASTVARRLQALGIPFREGMTQECVTPPIIFAGTALCRASAAAGLPAAGPLLAPPAPPARRDAATR